MNNNYDIINNYSKEVEEIENLRNFINYCLEKLKIDNTIFNIIFIDNESIKLINKDYRNIDKETDVISFALEDNDDFIFPNDFRLLGDIYISIDKTIEQANLYEHSFKRELSFLAIHGLLHLLGYDHIEESDSKKMFSLQEELLSGFEITRK